VSKKLNINVNEGSILNKLMLQELESSKRIYTDVVIIGSGVAGLFTALNLDPGIKCIIINKSGIDLCNSMYAQGGIAAVVDSININDNNQLHLRDTLEAGAGHCDEVAVKVLVDEAEKNIIKIMNLDVVFDTGEGKILLTREGGHTERRILHCGGDATGLHITKSLYQQALSRKNIKIISNVFLCDIIVENQEAIGVTAIDENDKPLVISSSKIVIASGGVGRVFRNSTNAICCTGDGIAAAKRAGVKLQDMEFIQFHPTALIHPSETGRFFLISEALRGEGGVLRNRRWEPFMKHIHPLGDLAPRDIVTRGIISEMKKDNIPNVYLDITQKPRGFLMERFPTIYNECMKRGIDIAKNWIPVMPVQHYFMGGIKTDINARTNIKNLYASGEAACTGVHGANRLASNSLLECIVFSGRCADDINKDYLENNLGKRKKINLPKSSKIGFERKDIDLDSFSSEIRSLATLKCGIIRNETDLQEAQQRISEIIEILDNAIIYSKKGIETYNMAIIAIEITRAAIARKKSIGAHYRSDDQSLQ